MRIRSYKPEFWRSADTAELSYFGRLLFLGLLSYADDNGVGEDNVNLIRSDLFPRDDITTVTELIITSMNEAAKVGLIVRYRDTTTGRSYFWVTGWHHQKISHPTKSPKPLPTSPNIILLDSSGTVPESSGVAPELTGNPPEPFRPDLGNKGTREQGIKGTGEAPAANAVCRPSMLLPGNDKPPEPAPPDPGTGIAAGGHGRVAHRLVKEHMSAQHRSVPANRTAMAQAIQVLLGQGASEDDCAGFIRYWNDENPHRPLRFWEDSWAAFCKQRNSPGRTTTKVSGWLNSGKET